MYVFCADNPVTEIEDYRMEVLIRVSQLDILDKDEFVPEEKQDALAAYEERKAEFDLEDVEEEEVLHLMCSFFYSMTLQVGHKCCQNTLKYVKLATINTMKIVPRGNEVIS